jgi:hypothetical protein
MIDEKPPWVFAARHQLSGGYEHVHLVGGRVLGFWVCLDRSDGTVIWDRAYWRPDEIVAVAENVVVATEEGSSGCFGISLETGRLLWTSHASGAWGTIFRALDFLPFFANELRDAPHHVQAHECFCYSGRVIDLCSGRDLRRIPKHEVTGGTSTADSVPVHVRARMDLAQGRCLAWETKDDGCEGKQFQLHLTDTTGSKVWSFHIANTRYYMWAGARQYRYTRQYGYLVVSEEYSWRPASRSNPCIVDHNATRYHLLTLELAHGTVIQDVLIDERPLHVCRIEDCDDQGLLIGFSLPETKLGYGNQLKYYPIAQERFITGLTAD